MSLAGDLRMLVERRQAEEGASDFLRLVQIAADQLDRLEVPVVRVQMQAAQARIATLRHNHARGTEDDALAALVIQQLDQLAALDWAQQSLLLTDQQVSAILDSVDHLTPEEESAAGDAYQPTLTNQPDSEAGGVYQLGEHRLACGDATKPETWNALLEGDDQQIQLLVTDPPYGVSYLGGLVERVGVERRKIENDDLTAKNLQAFLHAAFQQAADHMQPGAAYYVYSPSNGGQMLAFFLALRDAGLAVRQQLVWVKDRFVFGRSDYHYRHEGVLYGWKADAPHRQHRSLLEDDRTQDTVWEYPRPTASAEHPTMKPVAMLERLVRNSAHRGALVADPFAGSGCSSRATTPTAAPASSKSTRRTATSSATATPPISRERRRLALQPRRPLLARMGLPTMSLADDLRHEARCVHSAAADAMRFAADELDRGTAERDALHADFRRCHELIWLAEKHIPRDALTSYYAEKNAADPPQNTQGPEVGS